MYVSDAKKFEDWLDENYNYIIVEWLDYENIYTLDEFVHDNFPDIWNKWVLIQ